MKEEKKIKVSELPPEKIKILEDVHLKIQELLKKYEKPKQRLAHV
jgi:hypothetical protein